LDASAAWDLSVGDAEGVSGALKGCAADVDVAGGGVCEEVVVVVGVVETGVAFERRVVVEMNRCGCDGRALEAARRQLRQIILFVVVLG
jgi:hypothetical protein